MLKSKKHIKRMSIVVLIIIVMTNALQLVSMAASAYSDTMGTTKSMGSPLVNEEFVLEDWDKWEMLCFGIFISNFCKPFVDDYSSAFTKDSANGSKGAGLTALQFAAGGDSTSNGMLGQMLDYCKMTQGKTVKPIKVKYDYYEYGKNMELDLGSRDAKLGDLFPRSIVSNKANDHLPMIKGSLDILNPMVMYDVTGAASINPVDDYTPRGNHGVYDYDIAVDLIGQALVDKLYIDTVGLPANLIFDMTDGYDLQMIGALINKAHADGTDLIELFKTNPQIYFDMFGNICMQKDSRYVIIIPASCNQHLTATNSINMVNSLVVNSMGAGSSQEKMIANAMAPSNGKTTATMQSGGPAVCDESEDTKFNKLIVYNDTDTDLISSVYKYIQDNNVSASKPDLVVVDDTDGHKVVDIPNLSYDLGRNLSIKVNDLQEYKYGNTMMKLLGSNAYRDYPLKFEITGATNDFTYTSNVFTQIWETAVMFWTSDNTHETSEKLLYKDTPRSISMLANMFPMKKYDEACQLDWIYIANSSASKNKAKEYLFNDKQYYYMTPSVGGLSHKQNKDFINYYLKIADGSQKIANSTGISGEKLRSDIVTSADWMYSSSAAFTAEGTGTTIDPAWVGVWSRQNKLSPVYQSYLTSRFDFKADKSEDSLSDAIDSSVSDVVDGIKVNYRGYLGKDYSANGSKYNVMKRVCKVYKPTDVFSTVAAMFEIKPEAQFMSNITNIYLTYLQFYGIIGNNNKSKFKESLFAGADFLSLTKDSFDASEVMTKEEKENAIRNNSYLMLAPTKSGRDYRANMVDGMIKDITKKIYETTVSNGEANYGDTSGFLNVSSYKDNFITSWFISNYSWIQLVLFSILGILALFNGVISGKGIVGILAGLVSISVSLYAVPAYLEMTPYFCNKIINSFYGNNGIYWAVAESITNIGNEKEVMETTESLDTERKIIASLQQTSFLQQDKTLMIKNDISKKVLNQNAVNYEEIQGIKSARWLLPSLMQQITYADTYDYVSMPLSDLYSNMELSYMGYKAIPNYSKGNYVSPSQKFSLSDESGKTAWFGGYTGTGNPGEEVDDTTCNISRIRSDNELVHTQIYLCDMDSGLPDLHGGGTQVNQEAWKNYSKDVSSKVNAQNFTSYYNKMIDKLNTYNMNESPVDEYFGYLWTTENLGAYMYSLVLDTFGTNADKSVGYLMYNLQGQVVADDTGKDARISFMHKGNTGYTRDVLDLKEIFTNVVPYMYQMQLTAGGDKTDNGVLGKAQLVGYDVYKKNDASWLFRCNWVTKLMEDRMYCAKEKVNYTTAAGESKEAVVESIIDPRNYPADRPMVFSESQMYSQNLKEEELTFVELKCIEANKVAVNEWTKIINFANMSNLDTNTIFRTMALTGMISFNKTFTRDNLVNSNNSIFPISLDLRNISFDTLMKRLVASSSDGFHMGGKDIMGQVIDSAGLGKAVLLLLAASLSSTLMPFVRNAVLSAIFICSIMTIILNFSVDSRSRLKATCGWTLTSVIFCTATVVYYMFFSALCAKGDSGTLIRDASVTVTTNLTSKLLAIIVLDVGYMYVLFNYIRKFVMFKGSTYLKDGGFSMFYDTMSRVSNSIGNRVNKVGNGIKGLGSSLKSFGGSTEDKKTLKTKVTNKDDEAIATKGGSINDNKKKVKDQGLGHEEHDSSFVTEPVENKSDKRESNKINKEIEHGKKEISKEEKGRENNGQAEETKGSERKEKETGRKEKDSMKPKS